MSADAFNANEWASGRLRIDHLTEMTRIAQRDLGLPVDGKCGAQTRAALFKASDSPDITTAAGLLAAHPRTSSLAATAVEIALSLRGRGEEGANNSGPFIAELGGKDGDLWCALFAGHCWRQAHAQAGSLALWTYRRKGVAEPGARALVEAAKVSGTTLSFVDPSKALPGDLALWKRDGGHHVALVWRPLPGGIVATIDGNVGAFPASVRDLVHDVRNEPHFVAFVRPPHL